MLSDLTMTAISGNETYFTLTDCTVPVTNQFCLETTAAIDYDQYRFHRLRIQSQDNFNNNSSVFICILFINVPSLNRFFIHCCYSF